jgi:hypothetical protein
VLLIPECLLQYITGTGMDSSAVLFSYQSEKVMDGWFLRIVKVESSREF